MSSHNIDTLKSFGIDNIPNLDVAVLGALELFQQKALPHIDTAAYLHPLVVGSGNAEATGKIVFEQQDAIFASESNFEEKLKNISSIDGVILVSASGSKHAPIIARAARQYGKRVTLITNTAASPASAELDRAKGDQVHVFPKNREPYTYNTSTYLSMILGASGEDPAAIYQYLVNTTAKLDFPDFRSYDKYYLIVPPQFSNLVRMLQVKFIELFGRNIARDVETTEYVRHATTIAPAKELFISFGEVNDKWGAPADRFFVPLPERAGYGAMMAVGYFTVSQIQNAYPHFFKDNLVAWSAKVSKLYGQSVTPIVEA